MSIRQHGNIARPTAVAACWALVLFLFAALITPPQSHELIGPNGQIVIGLPDVVADDNVDQFASEDGPHSAHCPQTVYLTHPNCSLEVAHAAASNLAQIFARANLARAPPAAQL
jgi:hypothetical protein